MKLVVSDLNFIRYAPSKINRFTFMDIDCQFVIIEPMGHFFQIFADRRISSTTFFDNRCVIGEYCLRNFGASIV